MFLQLQICILSQQLVFCPSCFGALIPLVESSSRLFHIGYAHLPHVLDELSVGCFMSVVSLWSVCVGRVSQISSFHLLSFMSVHLTARVSQLFGFQRWITIVEFRLSELLYHSRCLVFFDSVGFLVGFHVSTLDCQSFSIIRFPTLDYHC